MDTQDDNSILNGDQQQPGSNLLLRLVNRTYLSLPLSNCFNYTTTTTSSNLSSATNKTAVNNSPSVAKNSPDCPTLSRLAAREFCHVDWPHAKVIQQQQHPSSGLVSNSSREFKLNALLEIQNRTSIEQTTPNTYSEQQHSEDNLSNPNNLFRSTYFTVSPVLASSTILINFFIILIIIFNTKQKRSPLIRANSTGQNSLLLFQLSLTGLLLAGYVLMEDISLKARLEDLDLPDASRLHDSGSTSGNIHSTSFNHRQLPVSTLITFNLGKSSSRSSSWTSEIRNFAQREQALILEHSIKEPRLNQSSGSIWLIQSPSSTRKSIESVQLVLPELQHHQHHQHQHKHHHQHARHQIRREELPQQLHQCDNFSGIPAGAALLQPAAIAADEGLLSMHLPMLMRAVAAVYVWTVAALAYDRYYAIAHPLQYLRSFHNSRTPSFMTSTWLIAIVLSYILPLLADYRWFHLSAPPLDESHPSPAKARLMFVSSHQFMSSFSSSASSRRFKSSTTTTLAAQHRPAPLFEEDNNRIFEQVLQNILDIWRVDNSQLFDNSAENEVESRGLLVSLATKLTQLALAAAAEAATAAADGKLPVHETIGSIHTTIVVMLSLVTFVVAITIPLTIVSVCNISIYRIVKVHERRLSVSSGSNAPASTSNISNHQHRQNLHQRYRVADDKSDVLSVTSLLLRRFLKGNLFMNNNSKAENLSCSENDDEMIRASNNHHQGDSQDYEKLLITDGLDLESAKVSPKRIVVRQNSQQILTKLQNGGQATSPEQGTRRHQSQHDLPLYHPRRQRNRLKRKTSDHAVVNNFRRSSFTSQPGDHLDYDHTEQTNPMVCGDKTNKPDNGLINQIKLAGLSFAGIAIQEPSFNYSGRLLDKSTSCSLSNLHNHHGMNHCSSNNQQQRGKTVSRCSVESSPTGMSSARKSYVSLANACKPQESNKYMTRLVDNCSDEHLLEQQPLATSAAGNCHHHSHHHRLTSTIGTKSAAFNALIWLVAGLLLFSLAHYSLSIYLYARQVGSPSDGSDDGLLSSKLESLASALLALSNETQDQSPSNSAIDNLFEGQKSSPDLSCYVSVWLAYSCRVIFLSMLLLNGWLYGIRSRLLRTKMRMVLKKYISRRQASIEINHRNRSISSIRSRDSSFISLPHLCYGFANQRSSANCLACLEGSDRASCKNLKAASMPSKPIGQHKQQQTPAATSNRNYTNNNNSNNNDNDKDTLEPQSKVKDQSSGNRLNQASNSIRFMIGDYGFDGSRDQADDSGSFTLQTAPTSVTSSLNASCRSLISSSIHSSQSAAFLLIEPKLGPDHTQAPATTAAAPNSPVVSRKQSLENSVSSPSVMKASNHHSSGNKTRAANNKRDSANLDASANPKEQSDVGVSRARRCSQVEVSQQEAQKCPQVKKSSSEFRIYVTAADHEPADLETRKVLANKTFGIGEGTDVAAIKIPSIRQRVDSMDSWCKELKQNLTKLLSSTSSNNLSLSRLYHPAGQQQQHQSNSQSRKHTDLEQVKSAAAVAGGQQRRRAPPLIRSQSDDREMPAASWRNLFTSGETDHHSSPLGKRDSPLRSSLTMSNIEKLINCHRHRQQQHSKQIIDTFGAKEGGGSSGGTSASSSQPPAHLKPPNFLKLMFDPNNGTAYPVASALSPIKECSSNHSYASSQSSLNNAANVIAAVAAAAANHQQTSGLANVVASESGKRTDSRSCSSTSSNSSGRD